MKGYRRTYLTESKDKQTGCALEFTPVAPLGAYSESLFFFFFVIFVFVFILQLSSSGFYRVPISLVNQASILCWSSSS